MRTATSLPLLWTLLAPATAGAQADVPPPVGSLTLLSTPSGCVVRLSGEQRIDGRTPLTLARSLTGRYRVLAQLDGYESWRRTVPLDGRSADTLWIQLSPKSAFRAGLRSLIVPGWGQFYDGRPGRGWVLLGAGLAAGAALAVGELRYADRVDDYEAARERYRAASTVEEIDAAYAAYRASGRRAEDAYDDRQLLAAVGAAVWAAGLLDAVLFFEGPSAGEWRTGPVALAPGRPFPALALQRRF